MITAAIIGTGSRGGNAYGSCILKSPDRIKVTSICEINRQRLQTNKLRFGLDDSSCYSSEESFFKAGKLADVLLICTQDRDHYRHAMKALQCGYHILLEKPISPALTECYDIMREAKLRGLTVSVCHVLRYTAFFSAIKKLIDEKAVGDLVSYEQTENIGFFHFAHSFVRGNWRNESSSAPMVLAKTCHDLDIINDMLDGRKCLKLSSEGSLFHFRPENAPKGASRYCLDGKCSAKAACPYDAEKIYISKAVRRMTEKKALKAAGWMWPVNVVANVPTYENVVNALKDGPYGRCVYACDNDVADNQVVLMEFEGKVSATLHISAFSNDMCREVRVRGSLGEIIANESKNQIILRPFGKPAKNISYKSAAGGHGGGDSGIINDFIEIIENRNKGVKSRTSIENSVISHAFAAAAEISRKQNKTLDIPLFLKHYEDKIN